MHLLSYAPYISSIKPGSIKGLANVAYGLTQSAYTLPSPPMEFKLVPSEL